MDLVGGSIRVPDGAFISPHNIPLSQVRVAAWMEVAEWRDDIICRNRGWVLLSSCGLRLGCGEASNKHRGGDQLEKSGP
jgi:hypothetical protein